MIFVAIKTELEMIGETYFRYVNGEIEELKFNEHHENQMIRGKFANKYELVNFWNKCSIDSHAMRIHGLHYFYYI